MDSGKHLRHKVDFTKGDPEWPLTEDELLLKFRSLASYTIGQKQIEKAISLIMDLEQISDMRELVQTLTKE